MVPTRIDDFECWTIISPCHHVTQHLLITILCFFFFRIQKNFIYICVLIKLYSVDFVFLTVQLHTFFQACFFAAPLICSWHPSLRLFFTHLHPLLLPLIFVYSSSLASIILCALPSLSPSCFRHTYRAVLILNHLYSQNFTHLCSSSLTFIQLFSPSPITQLSTKLWVLLKIPAFLK